MKVMVFWRVRREYQKETCDHAFLGLEHGLLDVMNPNIRLNDCITL